MPCPGVDSRRSCLSCALSGLFRLLSREERRSNFENRIQKAPLREARTDIRRNKHWEVQFKDIIPHRKSPFTNDPLRKAFPLGGKMSPSAVTILLPARRSTGFCPFPPSSLCWKMVTDESGRDFGGEGHFRALFFPFGRESGLEGSETDASGDRRAFWAFGRGKRRLIGAEMMPEVGVFRRWGSVLHRSVKRNCLSQ